VQINISARHGDVSSDTHDRISEKARKLPRYFDRLTAVNVTVDLEHKDEIDVEIRASAEHTDDFVATATGGNIIAAFDSASQKLEKQLRRYKDKRTGHRQTSVKHLEPEETQDDDE